MNLKLHEKQFEVFSSKHRFRVAACGRRWGKSYCAAACIIDEAKVPNQLIWYVAPTYKMAKNIMWRVLNALIPKKWVKRSNETTMLLELINGTIIELKGCEKPDLLRGVGINFLVLDEMQDIKGSVWLRVLRPTLATTRGRALFIGSPKNLNFFYKLHQYGSKKRLQEAGQWMSWQFPTSASPFVPASEIAAAKREMDAKSFRAEFMASFEQVSGLVYHAFSRKKNVGSYPFNPKLPIWVGQDFNIDPMAAVILQPQPSGEIWCVDEIVRYSSNTMDACEEVERRYWRHLNQITIYPDPASKARQHARGETDWDIFREKGMTRILARKKHPAVKDRINCVNRMFEAADGTVRLKVDSKCKTLIDCCERLVYVPGSDAPDKSMGIDHIGDGLGYPIEYEFPLRKIEVAGLSI
jgi:hypothetical protein